VVPPWADATRFHPRPRTENSFAERHAIGDALVIMYSGNMGLGHDLESMWQAARELVHEPGLRFFFIGDGPKWKWLSRQLAAEPLPNTLLLPWQTEDILPDSLAAADVALVSLEPELTGLAVPSKAYYFLSSGVPLIGICDEHCELAELITDFGCGRVIAPRQPGELANLLRGVARDRNSQLAPWREGTQRARAHHDRFVTTQRFANHLATAFGWDGDDAGDSE
ncbi:MAG TPA: glycosyltransferase, partial [Pirellulaceae bacterium]